MEAIDSAPKRKREILAIIPARGGSKGIPRKNIANLGGKPLIAYTILSALKSNLVTRVVVSTEDEEIAEVALAYGAEVPFMRPIEFAGDQSSPFDAIKYTLERLKKRQYNPQFFATLLPTHPFRRPDLIDFCLRILIDGYNHVRTVKRVEHGEYTVFYEDGKGLLQPLKNGCNSVFFRSYGSFSGVNRLGHKGEYIHQINDPISLVDIDTSADLCFAEEILKHNCYSI